MAAPRLDKEHGFIKFIANSLLAMDIYEKEQKAYRYLKAMDLKNKIESREERNFYMSPDPSRGNGQLRTAYEKKQDPTHTKASTSRKYDYMCHHDLLPKEPKILFELEYIPRNCSPVLAKVYLNSSPESIVQEVSGKCFLTNTMKDALYMRILEEMEASR